MDSKSFTFQDPEIIDEQVVNEKLVENNEVTIQFSRPGYTTEMLSQLNRLALANSAKLKLRFYSDSHADEFDCANLEQIFNVKSLFLGCFPKAKNIHIIQNLNFLEEFGLSIFNLEDLEILSFDNLKKVKELFISETKSKALNLEYLKDYKNLTHLTISDHTKNIDAISNLTQLKELRLLNIKNTSLTFINGLKSLKKLEITLGGRDNINEIELNGVEELEISWVRGLNDLSGLKNFKTLKTLLIQNEIRLSEISFPKLDFLEDVRILDCKTLKVVSGLDKLGALTDFRISRTAIDFDDFCILKFPEKLKTLAFYTGKSKQDKLIRSKLDEMGFNEFWE